MQIYPLKFKPILKKIEVLKNKYKNSPTDKGKIIFTILTDTHRSLETIYKTLNKKYNSAIKLGLALRKVVNKCASKSKINKLNQMFNQLKKLGSSCDWESTRFTMDEGLSGAVLEVFVKLYRKKLIYRGN